MDLFVGQLGSEPRELTAGMARMVLDQGAHQVLLDAALAGLGDLLLGQVGGEGVRSSRRRGLDLGSLLQVDGEALLSEDGLARFGDRGDPLGGPSVLAEGAELGLLVALVVAVVAHAQATTVPADLGHRCPSSSVAQARRFRAAAFFSWLRLPWCSAACSS